MCTDALKVSAIEALKSLKSKDELKKQSPDVAIAKVLETVLKPIEEEMGNVNISQNVMDILRSNASSFDLKQIGKAKDDYDFAVLTLENAISILGKESTFGVILKDFIKQLN